MSEKYYLRKTCRICGGENLVKVLDLGKMPPANAFLKKEDLNFPEDKFPLTVLFCKDCFLVQVPDVVDPNILFKNYDYLTSASKPLTAHFIEMAHVLRERFITSDKDLFIEIGGNDGTLLDAVKDTCHVLNIDPATNIAQISNEKGIQTINKFFTDEVAQDVLAQFGPARVIVANNVMAHIDDLHSVFRGVKALIGENGVFVFEVHWVGNLIAEGGFDQIYHEHLCYHSLLALRRLVSQFGLKIFDIETVPIHGESIRVFVGGENKFPESERVAIFADQEKNIGLDKEETFLRFARRVEDNKNDLLDFLSRLKKEKKRICGYGAPAKGNTLLNYFGIGPDILDFLTDTTPLKQGLFSPGMHIPVVAPNTLENDPPEYILLLAWNYAEAILEKEEALRAKGSQFIIPVPTIRVV